MTATEAKKLTDQALRGDSELVKPWLESALKAVRAEANSGRSNCELPKPPAGVFHNLYSINEAVKSALMNLGFTVEECGDQRDGYYTKISW